MASAILARRNEPYWAEAKVYMRKPHTNSHAISTKPNPRLNPNPNPNPNPNFIHVDHDEPRPSTAAVSEDSSSFVRKPPRRDSGGFVSFNIATYTKKELRELKRRLESELAQVRSVVGRIESREVQSSARSVGHSVCGGREVTSSVGSEGRLKKRPPSGAKRMGGPPELEKMLAGMMSRCRQILLKLMKQKGSNWFNTPVDVKGMNLHDYAQIIKHPMDLGTVRNNLTKGVYSTPVEFAADVRLTFNNALVYNPKGHIVHDLAGRMLRFFDSEFISSNERYERQLAAIVRQEDERRRSLAWSSTSLIDSAAKAEPVPEISPLRPAMVPDPVPVRDPRPTQQASPQPQPQQQHMIASRPIMGRLPKPKARDLNKRPMSIEEKGKLSEGLQSLPQEKMDQVLQIVRRRNDDIVQDGDEIELDFESMDTETLWELDRFVGNCKKMMSKMRRQEAIATGTVSAAPSLSLPVEAGDQSPMLDASAAKRMKKGADPGDEDVVDIGEDMPTGNYPPVEIEKDNASSGSDSSSSSGSSGSDSDSSSGSDSEEGGGSPAVGSRSSP